MHFFLVYFPVKVKHYEVPDLCRGFSFNFLVCMGPGLCFFPLLSNQIQVVSARKLSTSTTHGQEYLPVSIFTYSISSQPFYVSDSCVVPFLGLLTMELSEFYPVFLDICIWIIFSLPYSTVLS